MNKKMLTKAQVVDRFLPRVLSPKESAVAFASSNIALTKYWGKRESELNLPVNSSLSISLGHLGSKTYISHSASGADVVKLNGQEQDSNSSFSRKVIAFIDLFRRSQPLPLVIDTHNNIPTAAGLASSASGFAALVMALNDFFNLDLNNDQLSAFARMGSGSASRSIYQGFVRWDKGEQDDGMDSIARAINLQWPNLCIGLIKVSSAQKPIDSRTGMDRTTNTSYLYKNWSDQAEADINTLENALERQDFHAMGACAEHNAMSMHATMISAWPPLVYWLPESLAVMQRVWQLREEGVGVYFTMDAGPNLKLLFERQSKEVLATAFPDMDVIEPF